MEIKDNVAAKISELSPNVKNVVVDKLAQQEIDLRVSDALKGLTKIDELEKDLKKVKPDQVFYNVDGTSKQELFSQGKLNEKNKKTAELDKWNKAMEKALEGNDYTDLRKLLGNKPDAKPEEGAE